LVPGAHAKPQQSQLINKIDETLAGEGDV
jgi:hypothetical protein